MLAGYWGPDLIQLAGGTDGLCRPGAPAQVVEWDRLQAYAPEVLLLSSCGSPLAQTRAVLPALQGLPGWDDLPAVRQGYVYAVDGQGYFHRPGPRIVDSLETLAGLLHPDLFGEFLPPEGAVILPCHHLRGPLALGWLLGYYQLCYALRMPGPPSSRSGSGQTAACTVGEKHGNRRHPDVSRPQRNC